MPEVSVIMPVYNMAKDVQILKAAVDSVRKQTYKDWELIICDDGSTDHTLKVLRQISGKDARIRLICNSKNRGAGYARNACIQTANGKYLAVMDADDLCEPQRLEKQAAFLDQHPEYALVGCNVRMINSRGIWGVRILEEMPDKKSFLKTLPFVHPSVMLRKEVVRELHGYAQTQLTRRAEDYEFLMRLYACGYKGYNIQEILLGYREDLNSYKKRKYRWRIDESRVRYQGFLRLGILKGNKRYVLKPLLIGMVPNGLMNAYRSRRFGIK